jgi:hypothetical protein
MDATGTYQTPGPEFEKLPEFHRNLLEAEAALMLVREGSAVSVTLTGFRHLIAIAGLILPAAQRDGIRIRIERSESGLPTLIVGPRLAIP